MNPTTQQNIPTIDLTNVEVLRWLADKLGKVQRARRRPSKPGRLHRV